MRIFNIAVMLLCFAVGSFAQSLSLYTETSFGAADFDDNWDFWQQDVNYPDANFATVQTEDVLYFCAYDGASGHTNDSPEYPIDGNVDGVYSTFTMGSGGAAIFQSLNVSGVNIVEAGRFEQRDTRVMVLVNLAKLKKINSNAAAIIDCKFRWSIDYVMPWVGSSTYLDAPSTMYVSVFGCDEYGFWRSPPDDPIHPNTPISSLQDIFVSESSMEQSYDLSVADGPGSQDVNGLRRLTNWTIEEYGVQFYELDFTQQVREILDQSPDLQWLCFTMRSSDDGDSVNLSVDATLRQEQNPIPPTVDFTVCKYLGDFDDNEIVDIDDFEIFVQQWLEDDGLLLSDFDFSGNVNFTDYSVFTQNWLRP